MSDYADACAATRILIRTALAKTARITGLHQGPEAEALVEALVAALHDRSTAWAVREILDRP